MRDPVGLFESKGRQQFLTVENLTIVGRPLPGFSLAGLNPLTWIRDDGWLSIGSMPNIGND